MSADADGLRAVLGLAALGLLAALFDVWAVLGDVGWTSYTPLDHDGLASVVAAAEQTGWVALGGWAAVPVAAAVALLACAVLPPRTAVRAVAALLLVAAAVVVALEGFAPGDVALEAPPEVSLPARAPLAPGLGAYVAVDALVLGAVALGLTAWTGRPRGAALLVAGAVLVATSLLLGWSWQPPFTGERTGVGTFEALDLPLVAAAVLGVVAAVRRSRPLAIVALAAAVLVAGLVVALGFRGGAPLGPYGALAGLWLLAAGAVVRLSPARTAGLRLAGVGGALLVVAAPFLPWGALTGGYFSRAAGSRPAGSRGSRPRSTTPAGRVRCSASWPARPSSRRCSRRRGAGPSPRSRSSRSSRWGPRSWPGRSRTPAAAGSRRSPPARRSAWSGRSRRSERADQLPHLLRRVPDPVVREAHDPPARGGHGGVAAAVLLERAAGAVELAAVGLDDEPRRRPVAVDVEAEEPPRRPAGVRRLRGRTARASAARAPTA